MSYSEAITRTDLANILNEVLPAQAGLRTAELVSGGISLSLYKSGGCVQVQSFGTLPATNDGTTIVTLPQPFRPIHTTDITVFDVDGVRLGTLRFAEDGAIKPTFGNLKAGNVRASWTFIGRADFVPEDADVVVEQGTSGIWTYRKWNSGVAECCGKYTGTVTYSSTTGASGGYRAKIDSISFPFTFTSAPKVSATHNGGSTTYWGAVSNVSAGFDAVSVNLDRGNAASNVSVSVTINVVGTWK